MAGPPKLHRRASFRDPPVEIRDSHCQVLSDFVCLNLSTITAKVREVFEVLHKGADVTLILTRHASRIRCGWLGLDLGTLDHSHDQKLCSRYQIRKLNSNTRNCTRGPRLAPFRFHSALSGKLLIPAEDWRFGTTSRCAFGGCGESLTCGLYRFLL